METGNKLYYSIGEVAAMLNVAPSVLRFWESEFSELRPVKNRKGTRNYTEHNIDLLRRIHYLTRQCGYTLEGAREQLRTRRTNDPKAQIAQELASVRQFLVDLKNTI